MRMKLKYTYRSRKNGRLSYRFEPPGGPKRWFKSEPGTPEFIAEWQRYMAGEIEDVKAEERRHVRPGSFAWLVNQYMASAAWAQLAPATQRQRLRFYKIFLDRAAEASADALTARDLRRMRDNRAGTPSQANNMLKAVKALYDWALEHELVAENPAKGVKHLPPKSRIGFKPWTIEDVRAFMKRWPSGTREHLALMLLLFTAGRRSDVVRLGRQHVRDGWLIFRQQKTGERVEIPILPPLAEAIHGLTGMTFLTTRHGGPFTSESFGNWFSRAAREAGVKKSAHGVRKAAGALLAEMGCTMSEIAAILGHTDERTTAIYTRSAERRRLAESAMAKLAALKW